MSTASAVSDYLNALLSLDPEAIQSLVDSRVECEGLMDDDHLIVLVDPDSPALVGVIGLVNGILSRLGSDEGIAAHYEEDGRLFKFSTFNRTVD